jgi:hypothetical protein
MKRDTKAMDTRTAESRAAARTLCMMLDDLIPAFQTYATLKDDVLMIGALGILKGQRDKTFELCLPEEE